MFRIEMVARDPVKDHNLKLYGTPVCDIDDA